MALPKLSDLRGGLKTPRDELKYLQIRALGSEDIWTIYKEAVAHVAEVLRPRFESGELRGWLDGDSERKAKEVPPIWNVERACSRLFVTSPEAGVVVSRCASRVARAHAVPWKWNDPDEGFDLRTGAASLMAIDVLLQARSRGWSKPKPGERPRQRASVAHGRAERVA